MPCRAIPPAEPLNLDEAVAAIEDALPGSHCAVDHPAVGRRDRHLFGLGDSWFRSVDSGERSAGNAYVAIDQYSGEVVYDGTPGEGTCSTSHGTTGRSRSHRRLRRHITRVLWTGLAMTPIALGATGTLMYLIRRRKRARRRPTATPATTPTRPMADAAL